MAVTRLKRKERRNISKAKARVKSIKRLSKMPVIKNVDIEAIKAEFDKKTAKPAKKAAKVEEVAVEESPKAESAE